MATKSRARAISSDDGLVDRLPSVRLEKVPAYVSTQKMFKFPDREKLVLPNFVEVIYQRVGDEWRLTRLVITGFDSTLTEHTWRGMPKDIDEKPAWLERLLVDSVPKD